MRYTIVSPNMALDIHGNLAGLGQDDHVQYALLDGRSGDTLKIDTIAEYTGASGITLDDTVKVDTIVEKTTDNGVLIEGNLMKDTEVQTDKVYTDEISEKTGAAGVTFNHTIKADTIVEKTTNGGVTIETMNIEDNTDVIFDLPVGKKYIFKINNVTVATIE